MDTVIVASSQFYSHYPKRIPQGTVNAEAVLIRLDSEWDGLTVRIHWLNVASGVEKVVLLERDQPNTIPWEVLTELGELRMGLVGLDGDTVIKPTIWLTYGYVSDGVDPESGSDPQPPTPSWEQQMVEQARVAAEAAEKAKDAAVNAGKAASQSGPYADEAKKSAEAAKEAQRAASTSAKQAANAKDQANIASDTAKGHADAAGAAKVEAERAAEMAGNAKSGAAQSAQASENSAKASEAAKQEAQKAASIFPKITPEDAGKVLMVSENGEKIVTGDVSGGGKIDDTTLRRNTTWSSLKIVDSLAPEFESSGPVVTCNPVPGYPLSVTSQIVPVQDGEGDPSPDNIRPISGYTGAKINIRSITAADLDSIIGFYASSTNTTATISDIYLSPAMLSGPYVPYNADSKAISVPFEDTVYGGKLNWTTGELTIDWVKYIATGNEDVAFGQENTITKRWYFAPTIPTLGNSGPTSIICDKLKNLSSASQDAVGCVCTGRNLISVALPKDTVPDADAVKGWLQANNPEFVYKTSKVETIQLSPTEILALTGANTIYTDTGDTTVSGRADPSATIKDLLARIDALEKAAIGGV